jgi:hypothetical protein
VEAHHQGLAGGGQRQCAANRGRHLVLGDGQLVVDEGPGELDGERRGVLLRHGDGVGPTSRHGGRRLAERFGPTTHGLGLRGLGLTTGGLHTGLVPLVERLAPDFLEPFSRRRAGVLGATSDHRVHAQHRWERPLDGGTPQYPSHPASPAGPLRGQEGALR